MRASLSHRDLHQFDTTVACSLARLSVCGNESLFGLADRCSAVMCSIIVYFLELTLAMYQTNNTVHQYTLRWIFKKVGYSDSFRNTRYKHSGSAGECREQRYITAINNNNNF